MQVTTITQAEHPPWCVDAHDDPADLTDSVHVGPPARVAAQIDDVDVTLALYRWDVRPANGRAAHLGQTGALLTVANHFPRPDGHPLAADAVLTVTDLRALARNADQLADLIEGTA